MGNVYRFIFKKTGTCSLFNIHRERAREAVREILAAELVGNDGLGKIILELDSLFLKDENTQEYNAFKEFYHFTRSSEGHFPDFDCL